MEGWVNKEQVFLEKNIIPLFHYSIIPLNWNIWIKK